MATSASGVPAGVVETPRPSRDQLIQRVRDSISMTTPPPGVTPPGRQGVSPDRNQPPRRDNGEPGNDPVGGDGAPRDNDGGNNDQGNERSQNTQLLRRSLDFLDDCDAFVRAWADVVISVVALEGMVPEYVVPISRTTGHRKRC